MLPAAGHLDSLRSSFRYFVDNRVLKLSEKVPDPKARGKLYTGELGKPFLLINLAQELELGNQILNDFRRGLPTNKTTLSTTGFYFTRFYS